MFMITALRDFADGLTRGVSLYLTERNDYTARSMLPRQDKPKPRV